MTAELKQTIDELHEELNFFSKLFVEYEVRIGNPAVDCRERWQLLQRQKSMINDYLQILKLMLVSCRNLRKEIATKNIRYFQIHRLEKDTTERIHFLNQKLGF